MKNSRTAVLVKPDGLQRSLIGEIISRFERKGLKLVGLKMVSMTDAMLSEWYVEHKEKSFFYRFFRKVRNIESIKSRELGRFFLGISLLLFSADAIVKLSKSLAVYANIDVFIIGLIILAIGTSLPEFAFSLRSLEDDQPSMFLGNILGSVIANSTLIVGISVFIFPLENIVFSEYLVAVITFTITFIVFWFFIKTKHMLMRWEAGFLILIYVTFLVLEFS